MSGRTSRCVTALAKDYPAGWHVPAHRHRRGQLVYAASGVMRVTTPKGIWIVPPLRAVWLPPKMKHEIRMEGEVAMRTLYLDQRASEPLGAACKVLFVSKLLRELVLEVVRIDGRREDRARLELMTRLLLCELQHAEQTPVHIPAPSDIRLKRVCNRLLDDPSRTETLDRLAYDAGASGRTLARLFERELKMTFVEWRQHVRLARALSQMAVGDSVKQTARHVGYESASAFTAMFRRVFGVTPTRYMQSATVLREPSTR